MKRIYWIDYAKTIGIIAVVFGHTEMPTLLTTWIYSFHMPLFFTLSGWLLPRSTFCEKPSTFLRLRIGKLLIAYAVFSVIGIFQLLIRWLFSVKPPPESIVKKIAAIFYASGTIESQWQLYPIILWFFPALMSGLIFCYIVAQAPRALQPSIVCFYLLLGLLLHNAALPWEIESGLCAAFFIYIGFAASNVLPMRCKCTFPLLVLGLFLLIVGGILAFANGTFDFRASHFGNILLSFPSFMCTFIGIYILTISLPDLSSIRRISAATLMIFPTHTFGFWIIDSIFVRLLGTFILGNFIYNCIKSSLIIVVTTAIAPYFLRLCRLQKNA